MVKQRELLTAKLQGLKTTLDRAPASEKSNNATHQIATEFNTLMETIGEAFPDLKEGLPQRIGEDRRLRNFSKAPVTYLDLEIMAEQALNLLQLVED